ncbi:N5-glutamine methyltransferase family protein [Paenibacillus sabinae]|uniref:Release factor glutamine methyltransferase n=1 Tax=Paenibacillus sabinae T27 TaxID=1268072 RepID=X4ZQJ9_9BACL|nr:HemK/PrmC family methyltransferase [Paenibacillus sabinae]AHV99402.1 N5-glutamine S-adenosyl-L-methionine-dependent methyltransferase [Paenibacillus sabinae T27]
MKRSDYVMPQVQSIREAFAEASSFLSGLGVSEPQRSAQLLLEYTLGLSGAAYYMALADPFPPEKRERWENAVTKRASGEPVQYITGEQEFYGRVFEVTPDVLIPRPETELLVEAVLRYAAELWPQGVAGERAAGVSDAGELGGSKGDASERAAGVSDADELGGAAGAIGAGEPGRATGDASERAAGVSDAGELGGAKGDASERAAGGEYAAARPGRRLIAIDIGAGSGAISVTLAAEAPAWRVLAGDISPAALAVAGRNAGRLGAAVELRLGDLLEPFEGLETDILVSNPPYIPGGDIAGLQREVRDHEPRTALDGGEDGLDPYRRMMEQLPLLPAPPRLVGFELGLGQAEQVAAMLESAGHWSEIVTVPDLAGIPRHVIGIAR